MTDDLNPDAAPAIEDPATSPSISPDVPEHPWARRKFVMGALGGIGAALAATVAVPVAGMAAAPALKPPIRLPFMAGSVPPTPRNTGWVSLGPVSNFEIGTPTLLPVTVQVIIGGAQQDAQIAVFVIRPDPDNVVILDIHCTHMGCPVAWSRGAKRFLCPCHGGAFDDSGANVAGPPPRPLDRYQALIANQEIWMGPLIEEA